MLNFDHAPAHKLGSCENFSVHTSSLAQHQALGSGTRPRLSPADSPALEVLSYLPVVLDLLDYGVVLLDATGRRALHVNQAAKDHLRPRDSLQPFDGLLASGLPSDRVSWLAALNEASSRGLRRFIGIGDHSRRTWVSIVPLQRNLEFPCAILVVLGKAPGSESLAIAGFARINRLTAAETAVFAELCNGKTPKDIARELRVAIATVRTHVLRIRTKTGASSVRAILAEVAAFPPLIGILVQRQSG